MLTQRPIKTFAEIALDVIGLVILCALCAITYGFLSHLAAAIRPVMQ